MSWFVHLPDQGAPQAQGSVSMGALARPGGFPWAQMDVQAGAKDRLLVIKHFPGREEQVGGSRPAQCV